MKKTRVLVSILLIFLMLMIPNVNAIEYTTAKDVVESKRESIQEEFTIIKDTSFDLKDAIRYLFQSVLLGFVSILSLFMLIQTLKYNDIGLTLLWLFDFILSAFAAIWSFKSFLNEIEKPSNI
jgi:hypothetical protein